VGTVEREDVEAAIRTAFAGVRLGMGISLQQARLLDDHAELTEAEFAAIPRQETTDDWTRIEESELLCDALGHLDAGGLRYYLPALMLWLLDHYNDDLIWGGDAEMTVIGTMAVLAPYAVEAGWHWESFESFTPKQRAAIAKYVEALPRLVNLEAEDRTRVGRSIERYWSRFLPA
jgi:hypothetical protein